MISHWNALRRPSASRVASIVPIAPGLELDGRLDRVVDLPAREERVHERGDRGDVADEEAREVDHVRTEVAERPEPAAAASKRHVSSVGSSPQSCR